jgi:Transposase, Mutator family
MNIIERGRVFVQKLQELAQQSGWDWRRCPQCGGRWTIKNGGRRNYPYFIGGRQEVRIQRHECHGCGAFYDDGYAFLVRGSWYAREVHRYAVDGWVHLRSSLRRIAETVRSWIGHQERWWLWHPWEKRPEGQGECRFHHSTVQRWVDRAGKKAQESVAGQLGGLSSSGQMGTDGLWVRLRGGGKRVLLTLVDSVTGLIWGMVVVAGEETAASWQKLFERAKEMGLLLEQMSGLTSDGAQGLLSYLREALSWVHHQRCVWHVWRNLAGDLASAVARATKGLAEDLAKTTAETVRRDLTVLLHAVIDASGYEQAEQALAQLKAHPFGGPLAKKVNEQFDRLLYPLLACHQGLVRIAPEWLWRDFRLRLSRGRNHGSEDRFERAGLLWAVYHDFTPAQRRRERKRHYKHPGQSPLEVAGGAPGEISYLDALSV